jgi:23S rRNA U2552 (ribose-2'-O)-methylase RlmE/FtsJ
MKAILEFQYPEDEERLRHALHGQFAISVLSDVYRVINDWQKHDHTEPDRLIDTVKEIVGHGLADCGEE